MATWEEYDPTWLVALAHKRLPANDPLIAAVRNCTQCIYRDQEIYFVDPEKMTDDGYLHNVLLSEPPNSGVWVVSNADKQIVKLVPGWVKT
jgi:hypothetical protein